MELKTGERLRGATSTAELIVVHAPSPVVDLRCGGGPLLRHGESRGSDVQPAPGEQIQLGKRYFDDETGLELLCTKAGNGDLEVDGRLMTIKAAKPLPASD